MNGRALRRALRKLLLPPAVVVCQVVMSKEMSRKRLEILTMKIGLAPRNSKILAGSSLFCWLKEVYTPSPSNLSLLPSVVEFDGIGVEKGGR